MSSTRKTPGQYKEQTHKLREATRTAIAELKRQQALKAAELRAKGRRAAVLDARARKKKDDHAKILIGVAMIHRAQKDATAQKRLKEILHEFYAGDTARLDAALYGMTVTVVTESGAGSQEASPAAQAA